jgi:hypothetical protein
MANPRADRQVKGHGHCFLAQLHLCSLTPENGAAGPPALAPSSHTGLRPPKHESEARPCRARSCRWACGSARHRLWSGQIERLGHWALTHFLLDGHHKMEAAAIIDGPFRSWPLLAVGADHAAPSGFSVLSVFPVDAKPWRAGAVSRFGEADRMRRDRRERPRQGSRERDNGSPGRRPQSSPGCVAERAWLIGDDLHRGPARVGRGPKARGRR